MAALWFGAVPLLSSTLGYLPMRALGQGEDIPGGVAREWASWGRDPRYVGVRAEASPDAGFSTWRGRLRAIAIGDDPLAPEKAVRALVDLYQGADGEVVRLEPSAIGSKRVGHFGWFKGRSRAEWAAARAWLLQTGSAPVG
jgi:predicted alpha/beta hydrolase